MHCPVGCEDPCGPDVPESNPLLCSQCKPGYVKGTGGRRGAGLVGLGEKNRQGRIGPESCRLLASKLRMVKCKRPRIIRMHIKRERAEGGGT